MVVFRGHKFAFQSNSFLQAFTVPISFYSVRYKFINFFRNVHCYYAVKNIGHCPRLKKTNIYFAIELSLREIGCVVYVHVIICAR